jgi:peptidoglycan/LPS O-acetylase OafA/YrhL
VPEPQKTERLAYLDVIRGVAALAVAVQHACEAAFPGYRDWSVARVNFGVFGVVAFWG